MKKAFTLTEGATHVDRQTIQPRLGFTLAEGATHVDRQTIKSRLGFTLAEVLVTLGVIGVVAALTIPTLIKNYQNTQYVTGAKKAYTQMNQVLKIMAVDSGENDSIKSYFGTSTEAGKAISSYYKVLKTCGTTAGEECFAKFDNYHDGSAKSTTFWDAYVSPQYKFTTMDGMSFAINSGNNKCTSNRGFDDAPDAPVTNSTCGDVYIDVNGTKKPNYFGRDVFLFYITSNKTPLLYPIGGFYTSSYNTGTLTGGGDLYWNYNNDSHCSKTSKGGTYCTGRLMENGWVMDW